MPRKKRTFEVIEIDKLDTKPLGSNKEIQAAVLALRGNLGFEELLRRHRVARAILRHKLEREKHTDIREVDRIQALLQAYSLVEDQLRFEDAKPRPEAVRPAFDEEETEFKRVARALEIVGRAAN